MKPRVHLENTYKLITSEDSLHLHKTLGVIVLFNYAYRYAFFLWFGHMNFQTKWDVYLLGLHALLSVSSLVFHIPNLRNPIQPMIYPEYRMHSILFALRSVVCCLLCIYQYHYIYTIGVCGSTLWLSNLITIYYNPLEKNGSTMRNMPFDKSISSEEQTKITQMHSYSQIGATLFMFGNAETAFSPMFAIQLAAFLMTLVRKGIIDAHVWHGIYSLSLWINYLLLTSVTPGYYCMVIAIFHTHYFIVFPYRIHKYGAWAFHFLCMIGYKESGLENQINHLVLTQYPVEWGWFIRVYLCLTYVFLFYRYRSLFS